MSCVCILTPVVIAAWPAFSAAVVAAATSLGYQVVAEAVDLSKSAKAVQKDRPNVQLEIENSEVVTNQLGRDQRIVASRDGVTITFSRDARGKASLCVSGDGHSKEELQAMGRELSQAVVQQYVYQKLMDEMRARGFNIVEEEVNTDRSIRLKVRHWEN
jgi:DNA-binding protein